MRYNIHPSRGGTSLLRVCCWSSADDRPTAGTKSALPRDMPTRHPTDQDPRYKWKVLGCVVFGIFMVILDTTVVNVAFPTIRTEFRATLEQSQWIVSIYVLALGISTPLAGFLSDRFGMKRMYVVGLGLFTLGSLTCALAPSLALLVAARTLQGMGGGIAVPLGTAMLFATFPPEEQGTALGYYGVALLMAPALGPILGGFLVDHGLWRWIFLLNIPIGATGIGLALRLLREWKRERRPKADPAGLVLSVIGFGAALYGASNAALHGWRSPSVVVPLAIGGAALALFAIVEMRVEDPLLDLRLYGNWTFLNASLVGYVTVLALFGAEFLLPIYLQNLRGSTALQTGITLLPLALVAGVTTPIAGKLYDRIGPRALVVTGFSVLCINTWQLSRLTAATSFGFIMFLMALRGFALGCTVQSTFTTALGTVPRMRVARGSSLINATRYVVQAVGVAILATVLAGQLSAKTRDMQRQAQEVSAGHAAKAVPARGICEGEAQLDVPVPFAQPPRDLGALRSACTENLAGFEHAYRITFYMAILAVLLGALLPGWPFDWSGRRGLGGDGPAPAKAS
jgi:EmrB/QacA subfamily drug resistance transporter